MFAESYVLDDVSLPEVGGWRCLGTWMSGQRLREVGRMLGSPVSIMVVVVAMTLGRMGGDGCSGGWLGLVLCLGH